MVYNSQKCIIQKLTGLDNVYSLTYTEGYEPYLHNILGYNIKIASNDMSNKLKLSEEVQQMPVFPAKGSCKMINGTVVVKFPIE